jgi:intracellular multiplication protein IcmB
MAQMIWLVIDEAYRCCTEVPDGAPKRYRKDVEPTVDGAIAKYRIALAGSDATWRDVVTAFCEVEEFRLAEIAQRYAMPVLEDLIAASRSEQVQDMFAQLRIQATAESVSSVFERYIYDAIRKYPTLNHPTRLDFGSARIIVLNLQEVAPRGSGGGRAPDRDDVYARSAHSGPQLLSAAGLRALCPRSGSAVSRPALSRGL